MLPENIIIDYLNNLKFFEPPPAENLDISKEEMKFENKGHNNDKTKKKEIEHLSSSYKKK